MVCSFESMLKSCLIPTTGVWDYCVGGITAWGPPSEANRLR